MSANTEHGRALAALGSDYANAASRIHLQQGDIAARDIAARGQIWGQAIGQIGQIAAQGVQQGIEARQEDQIKSILGKYPDDISKAIPEINKINPELGHKLAKQTFEEKKWAHELQTMQWETDLRKLQAIRAKLNATSDQEGWAGLRYGVQQLGVDVSKYSPTYDHGTKAQLLKSLDAMIAEHQGTSPKPPEMMQVDPTHDVINKATGEVIRKGVPKPDTSSMPAYGSEGDRVLQEENLLREQQGLPPRGAVASQPVPSAPTGPLSVAQVERGTPPAAPGPTPTSGLMAGESGGMPQLSQQPVPLQAPGAPEGAPPTGAAPPMTDAQRRVEAFKKVQEAKNAPAAAAAAALALERATDNKRADEQLEITRQHLAIARQNANKPGATDADRSRLVQAVVANPSLWDDLTNTEKGKIAPDLNDLGFTGFGKQMSEKAVRDIAQSKSAVDNLKDLKKAIEDNEQYSGPIAGLQKYNPWSDAPKLQAKINAVKQRVGKALEGGVLRKEDEIKYKEMLATVFDTPSTAYSKIDTMMAMLENDIRNYTNELRLSGRRVNTDVIARPADAAPSLSAPPPVKKGYHRVKGPNGEKGQSPIGAPLPKGWVEDK